MVHWTIIPYSYGMWYLLKDGENDRMTSEQANRFSSVLLAVFLEVRFSKWYVQFSLVCHFLMYRLSPDQRLQIVAWPPRSCDRLTIFCGAMWSRLSRQISQRLLTIWKQIFSALLVTYSPNCCIKWSKMGPLDWNIFEPAATVTCPKSY